MKMKCLALAALIASLPAAAWAQSAVFDQLAPPLTSTGQGEVLTQSYAVPGGTLYWTIFRPPGTNSPPSIATAFASSSSVVPQQAYHAISTEVATDNVDLTGANIAGGTVAVFADVTTVLEAGATLTLPSVAATVTAMKAAGQSPVAGMTYELDIYNNQSGEFDYTVTADSGATWTLSGTAQTIGKGTVRKYLATLTSLTAGTLQSLGEFTVTAAP